MLVTISFLSLRGIRMTVGVVIERYHLDLYQLTIQSWSRIIHDTTW